MGDFFALFAQRWEGRLFPDPLQRKPPWGKVLSPPPPTVGSVLLGQWWGKATSRPVSQSSSQKLVAREAGGEGGGFLRTGRPRFLCIARKVFLVTFPFLPLCVKITCCHFANSYTIGIG